jgi:ATP-dependent helicase/nuclease subunit B
VQIVFGWNLDGLSFPETVTSHCASYNSQVTGPAGLLALLETKLGLGSPTLSRALRTAQYLSLLQNSSSSKESVYWQSLQRDPWATAEYLLTLRDELLAAGWSGHPIDMVPRVTALAEIEQTGSVAQGFAERLIQVNSTIAKGKSKRLIDEITLVGPQLSLPPIYRQTIQLLQKSGTVIREQPIKAHGSGGDLLSLQTSLLAKSNGQQLELKGDGSVTILDADDEIQAAELTAAWLAKQEDQQNIALIRGDNSALLGEACQRYELPNIGTSARSQFRAILQVLPLSLELTWRPLDPRKLIEFLCIQGGPIPSWLASRLISALGQAPGMGSDEWNQVWNDTIERQTGWVKRDNPEMSSAEAEQVARTKVAEWQVWFQERALPENREFSLRDATDMCKRVEKWAGTAARSTGSQALPLYEIAANHARLLTQLLHQVGSQNFSLTQMRRMVQAVTGYGASLADFHAAPWSVVDHPGQIWGPAQTVCWWGFAQPQWPAFRNTIWSDQQLSALQEAGVNVEHPLDRFRRDSFAWQMPVTNAISRLVLIKPRVVAGQRAIAHPLWDELSGLIEEKQMVQLTVAANGLFDAPQLSVAQTTVISEPVARMQLPKVLRNWKVPINSIKARERESFSSIDKLLGCQLAWVLNYSCKMRKAKALDIPEKQLLLGKLAHAVVKRMYDCKKDWQPEEARAFAATTVMELVPKMASSLLLPGSAPQLRQARESIPSSVEHLTKLLIDADAKVEGCEIPLKAKINEQTELFGDLDLLVRLPSDTFVVLDFKWSSKPFFYRSRIVQGRALQLAIYSWLASQKQLTVGQDAEQSGFPAAGFFMFRHGQLFFTEDGIFPNYTVVRRSARTLEDTWNLTIDAYNREIANLKNGNVTATDVDPDRAELTVFTVPTMADPPCKFCDFTHFCGKEELQ